MKNVRVPSVPLVTCDPYFSLWSPSDHLYDTDTCHWTGRRKRMRGKIWIDGRPFRFLGDGAEETMKQTGLTVNPTASTYIMEAGGIRLETVFWTPLLLSDMELISRPASYIDWEVSAVDGKEHEIRISWEFWEEFCHHSQDREEMIGGIHETSVLRTAWMGKERQTLLGHSGDDISIDWGYFYLAMSAGSSGTTEFVRTREGCLVRTEYAWDLSSQPQGDYMILAYDDVASIMYFGEVLRAYWARDGRTIMDILRAAVEEHSILWDESHKFDSWLNAQAEETISEEYGELCALGYRQTIAAYKLVTDREGKVLFLSKECDSNGCIGTVDVSYPSAPLFLIFQTEYVKGMLRPVLQFAKSPVWGYDFAPHDVGRYPHVTGQVYGVKQCFGLQAPDNGKVYPPYYLYPEDSDIYRTEMQMPVEECGNILILAQAVSAQDGNLEFVFPYMEQLKRWADYLAEHGEDPGEQLCTDDFAGHLAHNLNLAVKAIMGLEAFSRILQMAGREEQAQRYHRKAEQFSESWRGRAAGSGRHTILASGQKESWSLKYNLVWDLIFGSELFSKEIYEQEIAWYLESMNRYGVPLDSRDTYTKSDWICWTAAMSDSREERQRLILPVVRYIQETQSRNPFPDWYDTLTGLEVHFHNRPVQGGLFMPIYRKLLEEQAVPGLSTREKDREGYCSHSIQTPCCLDA